MATSAQTGVLLNAMLPVAVVLNQVKDRLDFAWTSARQLYPQIFPTTLPARVLVKPNLCNIVAWENGVTTDPSWLYALVSQLRAIRPDVRIAVIESDALRAYKTYRSYDETFERLGYVASAAELGIELINLSKAETFDISLPGIPYPVRIPQLFLEQFYFVSVANLKVHPYEHMTSILKNALGLLPQADIGHYHPYLPTLIVDVDAVRARRFAERNRFPRWSSELPELFGRVDLAIVALPNHLHAPVSCELLAHGIHVLCEKPMARMPGVWFCRRTIAAKCGSILKNLAQHAVLGE